MSTEKQTARPPQCDCGAPASPTAYHDPQCPMRRPPHTPEPWREHRAANNDMDIIAGRWDFVATVGNLATNDVEREVGLANRRRIVACVNACAGIDPAAIPALIAAAEGAFGPLEECAEWAADHDSGGSMAKDAADSAMGAAKALRAAVAACRGEAK